MAETTTPGDVVDPVPIDAFDQSIVDLWRASKRGTAAVVTGLFPFIFIIDGRVDLAFSPVLPALLSLVIVAIVLPFLLMEGGTRIVRRSLHIRRRSLKALQTSNFTLGIAIAWFVLWMALGA
jgi:hypothetical protein